MNSQSPLSGRTILLLAVAAALAPAATAAPLADPGFGWTEMLGVVNGPTYDPFNAPVPRRRPGYPVPPPPVFPVINPDAVGPAPVDQVGEFLPVPDRWRIMESLGFKTPWYDPYNQNELKGDKLAASIEFNQAIGNRNLIIRTFPKEVYSSADLLKKTAD